MVGERPDAGTTLNRESAPGGAESTPRRARVYMHGTLAGILQESGSAGGYRFTYYEGYRGPPISLTMPTGQGVYEFSGFPAFFEGLLPEGEMLEGLLRQLKIDRRDYFSQLMAVGGELVGAVTVEEIP